MKVLGLSGKDYTKSFIIEISEAELSYLIGVYYSKNIPELNKKISELKPCDEINISELKSMTDALEQASKKFLDAYTAFSGTTETMLKFASLIATKTDA